MDSNIPHVQQHINKPSGLLGGVLVMSGLSLILQIVGLATKGWIVLHYNLDWHGFSGHINMGLWETSYCINGLCGTESNENVPDGRGGTLDESWTEYKAETCLALVACISVLLFAVLGLRLKTADGTKVMCIIACVGSFISAILALTASGKVADDNLDINNLLNEFGIESPVRFPYSVVCTGIGGILMGVAAFVLICATCQIGRSNGGNQGIVVYPMANMASGPGYTVPMQGNMMMAPQGYVIPPQGPAPPAYGYPATHAPVVNQTIPQKQGLHDGTESDHTYATLNI